MVRFKTNIELPQNIKDTLSTLLSTLFDFDIDVEIKRHRKKRSLDANSYFHVLVGKLAEAMKISKPFCKNMLLAKYGQLEVEESGIMTIIIKDEVDMWEREEIHLRPTSNTKVLDDGRLYRVYLVVRGSHTYDSKEMADLIDGTVSDCKEAGIETETPEMIQKMLEKWGVRCKKEKD